MGTAQDKSPFCFISATLPPFVQKLRFNAFLLFVVVSFVVIQSLFANSDGIYGKVSDILLHYTHHTSTCSKLSI